MRLRVVDDGWEGRSEYRTYVERQLIGTLGHLRLHVDRVTVRTGVVDMCPLQDVFRCRMVAKLVAGSELVEDEVDGDVYVATDRAASGLAQGLEQAVARRLDQ